MDVVTQALAKSVKWSIFEGADQGDQRCMSNLCRERVDAVFDWGFGCDLDRLGLFFLVGIPYAQSHQALAQRGGGTYGDMPVEACQ